MLRAISQSFTLYEKPTRGWMLFQSLLYGESGPPWLANTSPPLSCSGCPVAGLIAPAGNCACSGLVEVASKAETVRLSFTVTGGW